MGKFPFLLGNTCRSLNYSSAGADDAAEPVPFRAGASGLPGKPSGHRRPETRPALAPPAWCSAAPQRRCLAPDKEGRRRYLGWVGRGEPGRLYLALRGPGAPEAQPCEDARSGLGTAAATRGQALGGMAGDALQLPPGQLACASQVPASVAAAESLRGWGWGCTFLPCNPELLPSNREHRPQGIRKGREPLPAVAAAPGGPHSPGLTHPGADRGQGRYEGAWA